MTDGLSAYELKRLETIRKNQEMMIAMGLDVAISSVRAPAKPAPPKKAPVAKKPSVTTARRGSRRLSGMEVECGEGAEGEADLYEQSEPWRDPHDVRQMTPAELREWCSTLRQDVLQSRSMAEWFEELTAEERERLELANGGWLGPFCEFTARFGGSGEAPMSRENVKSVMKQVMKLVSGAGVTDKKRDGKFAAGRPVKLGITKAEVTQLRAEAQMWMPLRKAPFDVIGVVVDGVPVPKVPSSGPFDLSNGWFLNHPLMKIGLYCEHLDEVSTSGLVQTMRRLTGDETWGATPPSHAPTASAGPRNGAAGEEAGAVGSPADAAGTARPAKARVVDIDAVTCPAAPPAPAEVELPFDQQMVSEIMSASGMEGMTAKGVREALEARLGLPSGELKLYKADISVMIDAVLFPQDHPLPLAPSPKRRRVAAD